MNLKSIFLGTPQISVDFLEQTKKLGFTFDLIITNPDKPFGRKKTLKPSPVKEWASKNKIPFLTLEKINDNLISEIKDYNLFFVLAYGKILPQKFLDIPKYGTLNLHPSLLPKYRGPSPIMSAILNDDKKTGASLMLLDQKMDHGPILIQKKIDIKEWKKNSEMEKYFAEIGAKLFIENMENIILNKIEAREQEHDLATYCQKYEKKDMELFIPLNQRNNFLKYCAFSKPFYIDKNKKRNKAWWWMRCYCCRSYFFCL